MIITMKTIPTPTDHSEDEHSIVRLLSPDSTNQATLIQNRLRDLFGNTIWLQEPSSLHVTLMEIICDTEYVGKSRRQYFDEWYTAYNETVKDVLSTIKPFNISFTELLVSPRAIIIKSLKSEALNSIREALLKRISLLPGTKIPPDITHSTLARFNTPLNLDKAKDLTSKISVNIHEHISEFSLIRDLAPPDFNGNPMQVYTLKRHYSLVLFGGK